MWKTLRFLLLITLVVFAVYKLYPYFEDLRHIRHLEKSVNPLWILVAVCMQILQYASDGWLSQILLRIINFKLSFRDSLRIASLDIFSSHLLPVGRVGSVASVFYFYRKLGVDPEAIVFEVAAWAAVTSSVLIVIFLVSLYFLPPDFSYTPFLHLGYVLSFLLTIVLFFAFLYYATKGRIVRFFIKAQLLRFSWGFYIVGFLSKWRNYKNLMRHHPLLLTQAFLASAGYYLGDIATLAICFLAFGQHPSFAILTFAYTASLIAGMITLTPAGLGATDATLALVFLSTRIDPVISVGTILVFRLITFWLPIPAGAISYFSLKKKIQRLEV